MKIRSRERETVGNLALLLTAYEKYGRLDWEDYIEMYIDEELSLDISMLADYNEYLLENNNGDDLIYSTDELDDLLSGRKPFEIFRLGAFSRDFFCSEFFRFNGYGNMEGLGEYQVIDIMQNDTDFLRWYVKQKDLIDSDLADDVIQTANTLIEEGY